MVFQTFRFKFPVLLVCIHMAITWAGMRGAAALGRFELKPIAMRHCLLLALVFNSYNLSSLINLRVNSVGLYQVTKVLIAPAVMAAEWAFFGKGTSLAIKLCVLVMCVGVAAATVSDVQCHAAGLAAAAAAVAGATAYQLAIARLQKRFGASSNQLLTACIPMALLVGLIATPVDGLLRDEGEGEAAMGVLEWNAKFGGPQTYLVILCSGVAGLMVSLSTFLFIGVAGPLTYNVVGHIKTVTVLTAGWLVFGDFMSGKKLLGLALTMFGIVGYSVVKMRESSEDKRRKREALPR